ncbi:MAG: transporter [Bacteroidales bacterium]|nr:transporter [Bacteroidales bacterium]MBQ7018507.1 transporter [Bacteroidales bacterium]MBR2477961.1 transporter [Bacteroidales bacterium]
MNRSLILPLAVLFGFLCHQWCTTLVVFVPYLIFTILLLNFTAVEIRKLRLLHMTGMNIALLLFQIVVSLGGYLLTKVLGGDEIIAQGILIAIICPVAASSVVISCYLGANRETVTAHVILGNLMVAIVAPIFFSFIGVQQQMPFLESFWLILKRVSPIIAFPFFLALGLQMWIPAANAFINRFKGYSLYIWALALAITLGQTINFIFVHGGENRQSIIILGIVSVLICAVQFGVGKLIGHKYGDTVAGGQMLGQKNSALGIWMANIYLFPLASVSIALYSIWQNLFNSWQMYMYEKKHKK